MSLSSAFVNRPVMATAINLVLLIIGLVAYNHLELRHSPKIIQNEVSVTTYYPGGNDEAVEHQVTKPLEDALSGLDGIKKINSISQDGQSSITLKFMPNTDSTKALSQVRDRILSILSSLPESVKRPEIQEDSEDSRAILYLAFEDNTKSIPALSDYIRRSVEDRLRMVEGVSSVVRFGEKLYQITISPDPARMAQHSVTISEIVNALKKEKTFASGGEIDISSGHKETVVVVAPLERPDAFSNVTVKMDSKGRVSIQDIAEVIISEKPSHHHINAEGKAMVGLTIKAKPRANPLQVAARVNAFVRELQKSSPPHMKSFVVIDETKPFEASFISLHRTLWEAIILVGIIVMISLASFRAAILPMITVPLCLIGSFALMWGFEFSLNPVTFLALILAVGLVVDDAIVVVENIHRNMEAGLSALSAARNSMKEITFAVVVMTITLAAVYIPIAFQKDESAVMFKEFAWTLAGSVLISGFVALTLTPALCGKFLKDHKKIRIWDKISIFYEHKLIKALEHPRMICGCLILIALLGLWGFLKLPSELKPLEDEDYLSGYVSVENSVAVPVRDSWLKEINTILMTIPERERAFTGSWHDYLWWYMRLKPRADRNRGVREIAAELEGKFKNIVGPRVGVSLGNGSGMGGEEPLKINIQYAGEQNRLLKAVKSIIQDAKKLPEFENLQSEQAVEKPRIKIIVDRALASELGVSIDSIEDTLYTFLSGKKATDFNFQGFDYDVTVRADARLRSNLEGINEFFVAGGDGQWIPLGSLISIQEVLEPTQIKHYDRMRGASIMVMLKPDVSIQKAMTVLEPIVKKHIPQDALYRFGGQAEKYREAQQSMLLTFGLAIIFIYLVLAALFESFIHPFIVLLTVPLSMAGAIWAIYFSGGTNNIYTGIGLVTLIGLITKHGILIVDFANKLREQGLTLHEAVLKAAGSRLRPIIMTTLAMIFGAIPLIFSLGADAVARQNIGWVIIGGMLTGTLFSLFVIPVVYSLVCRQKP